MRATCLIAALTLLAACAERAPPPAAAPVSATPSPAGPQQGTVVRPDRTQITEPAPPEEPRYAPFDVGGAGQGPVIPNQVAPAFRGL